MPRKPSGDRLHIIIPQKLRRLLEQRADESGLTKSEHIRRALYEYLLPSPKGK